ncbi:MAG: hypothetical protein IT208_19410 [Chthonomonadales bacterium]|nr:hypothetical protein [Chthonomonadales bacterium]
MTDTGNNEKRAQDAERHAVAAQAQRDVAVAAAVDEAVNRDIAENEAQDARIEAAHKAALAHELRTQRDALSHDLEHARAAASSNAFGFYAVLAVLLVGILAVGLYFYYRPDSRPEQIMVNALTPAQPAQPATRLYRAPAPLPPPAIVTAPVTRAPANPPAAAQPPPAQPAQPDPNALPGVAPDTGAHAVTSRAGASPPTPGDPAVPTTP